MNHPAHRNVPVGTLHDHLTSGPRTITRDYSHALIPALELDVAGIDLLASILPGLRADMVAAAAEEAAEAAGDEDDGMSPLMASLYRTADLMDEAAARHGRDCR